MRKFVLLTVLVVLASWYFHFGRQMTQASVTGFYKEQLELMKRFEAEPLCATLAEDYRATDVSFSSAGTKRTEADKHRACEDMAEALGNFKKLSHVSRGLLAPTFRSQITAITLSDSDKLATVEGSLTVKMGEILIARTRFTEQLICRSGTIRSLGGQSKTWSYAGN